MMNNDNFNIEFEDSENFRSSKQESFSYKATVLRQVGRCVEFGSEEMHSGGTENKVINGEVFQFPKPNTRQKFNNAVDILRTLIKPISNKHKDIAKDLFDKYDDTMKRLKEKYIESRKELYKMYKNNSKELNHRLVLLENEFEDDSVIYHREYLFKAITYVLDKVNFMEERGF